MYKYLSESSYLGEIEVLKQIPRADTCMAPDNVEMFVMTKSLLDDVCEEFPAVADEMKALADEREVNNREARESISKMMKVVEQKTNESVPTKEDEII